MTGEQSDGAFAEYILCRAAGVLRLPEGLSPRHAALAEPLSVALHGITRSGVAPGDSVMVFGAGPIGALSVAALHAMGVTDVTVVEPHTGRRQLAADLGVTALVAPEDLEVFPPWEPERMSSRGSTSCSSALVTGPPLRPGSASWLTGGCWSWSAPASTTLNSTSTA